MRYEDTSGAFQASGPVANDDQDTLAAGGRGPATGNLITGEGTQYGAAGADSATGGHITAIGGQGGEDSSFSGGKLSVTGAYGQLSVDAEGNYSYLANKGAPENVRDRFTYTLADSAGNTDTGALIVEIGKTPAVIKANAQQIVPGPDGVVTLPPGVELSDIMVVGRNLVINMPDGTQLIIVDGAVFVPQLSLGGVDVPASNVAALLIGQEVQPAAGETPPSSGGNFALPPPPLDPGVPLGDLIPPTEYVYKPPEPQETFPIEDSEPTIEIQPDGQPAAVNAIDSVDEKGLPARNGGEPEGSGEEAAAGPDGDTSEATAGTILIDSPDGVASVTINGVLVTGVVGQQIAGDYGTLTITGFSGDNILYSYVLTDNINHADAVPDHDDFSVTLTDSDGDQATATLEVDIIDDVPTARNDTDATVNGVATGNVMTDAAPGDVGDSDTNAADTVGADNASLTSVSGFGGSSDSTFEGGFLNVNGQFGALVIDAQGNYTYTVNPNAGGGGVDVFTYTLTDGDGDTTTATLTITNPDLVPDLPNPPAVLLDDDALPGGIPGGTGDDVDSQGTPGQLVGSGGDGDLDYFFAGPNNLPAGFTANLVDASHMQILQGGTVVLTITLNNEDGSYSVVQNNPIDHPAGGDENNLSFGVGVQVKDADGDTDGATITINVDDDTPEMGRADVGVPTLHVDETVLADNDSADFSHLFNGDYGADGPGTTGYALSVVNGTDSGLDDVATGQDILLFNNGGVIEGRVGSQGGALAFTVSVNSNTGVVTLDQIRALEHPDPTNPDDPVSPDADSIQLVATITDHDGDSDSLGVNIGDHLVFDDDGPSVTPGGAEPQLIVDESNLTINDTQNFADAFNEAFGADGPAAVNAETFALGISNDPTGVFDTLTGLEVVLTLEAGVVVGRAGAGGAVVFTVSVAANGDVVVDQVRAVVHPDPNNPDDSINFGNDNLITLTATVTDKDGDSAQATIGIGNNVHLEDDGPSVSPTLNAQATATVDESLPSTAPTIDTGGIVKGDDPDLGGGIALGHATSGSAIVDPHAVFGADGPLDANHDGIADAGALTYQLSILNVSSGLTLTDGTPIDLQMVNGVIVGVVNGGTFDGKAAFAIAIDSNTGIVTLEQYLSLDHPVNPNPNDPLAFGSDVIGVTVTATDGDGDHVTSPAVDVGGQLIFLDDGPSANDDTDTTDPITDQAVGNVITGVGTNEGTGNADQPGADGFGTISNLVGFNGSTDSSAVGGFDVNGQYGTLHMDADGSYTYTRNGGPGGAIETFTYTYLDGDGDPATATLTITIADNTPVAGNVNVGLDDDALAGGNAGGVGDDPDSVNATGTLPGSGGDAPLTFGVLLTGAPAGFTYVSGGAGIVLVQQGGNTVLTITVNSATGAYSVVQNAPINHAAGGDENNQAFTINYTVTDSDNDVAPGTISISVDDDTPTVAANAGVQLDDDALAGGNAGGVGDDANATNTSGTLAHSYGADGAGSMAYLTTGAPAGFSYALQGNGDLWVMQGATHVLTLTVNATTGAYSVSQVAPIDHPAGLDENNVSFTISYSVTDHDGDSATGSIVVNVDDDTPTVSSNAAVQLDDDALAGGNAGGVGDVNPDTANTSGTLAHSYGADGAGSTAYLTTGAPVGFSYVLQGNGDLWIMQGATHVITLTVNATTGAYSVTQVAPIDHPAGSDENDVSFTVTYRVTDHDGDTADGSIVINVDDDTPTVASNAAVQLDDDALAGGNAGGVGDDANATNTSGTLSHSYGADGAGSMAYLTTGAPAGFSYALQGNGDLWVMQGATHVLTLTINATTGAYSVSQVAPIDHPAGLDENNVSFTISYSVTDHDGDSATGSIVVNVDDDTPTVAANAAVQLDDETLAGGIAGGVGDVNPNTANTSGTLAHSYGADGAGSTAYLTTGAPVGFSYVLQGNGDLWVMQGATHVITLTVNATTGAYTVTQVAPVMHAAGGDENDQSFTITYRVTDHDGDTADGTIVINVDDDSPNAGIAKTGQAVSVDESVGNQVDSNDTTAPAVIALFAGVANVGTDTHLPQYAQNASAIVNSTGSAYGADGAGTTVFSLNVSSAGVDSGLNTTDGHDILLTKEGSLIVGRVSGGADNGKAAFAIAIDPSTGVVSMVEYLSIQHPNAANADDMVSIADGTVLAVVTVTDADGDPATNQVAIGNQLQFQDSGPVMTAAQNMNIQNSGDVAHTANFAFNLGADGANITTNDVITNVTGSATVGGVAVTGYSIAQTSEDATSAVFTFGFDYPIGVGGTAHETGTLTFDKVNGTYTVDLADPIQGVTTILQTATGTLFQGYEFGTSTPDNSQPAISVTQIQDLAGTANDIYVQFTGVAEPSSGTGDNNLEFSTWVPGGNNPPPVNGGGDTTFNAGDLFNQVDSWVSTSNDSNGVSGDTIQGGEVLDFTLVQGVNPTGTLAQPAAFAQASSMFLKFDGIGASEDMIVVLKLYDPNTNTYTTRAVMIENGDIQKGPGTGPGVFSGITLDNNDGLVVIESNDYNGAGEHWVIVGAQIAGSDEGLTGSAINLNGATGAGGGSNTTGSFQAFSTDADNGPFKISSIGFTTVQTTPQNAHLDFNVTVTDGDGDSITQAIAVDVTSAADSVSAATIPAANTAVVPVVLDLNGDGVQFLGHEAGVTYNYGDGSVSTAWAGPADGILVRDANGNGTVDNASEFVFGSGSQTDLQALAAQYGSTLDANDADFGKFGVWQDANSNGVVDAGEFKSLTAMGITSINLVSDGHAYSAAGGDVEVAGSSTFTRADGSTGVAADANFLTGSFSDEQRQLSSSSSSLAIAAAVAAAGLASQAAAAHQASANDSAGPNGDHVNAYAPEVVEHVSAANDADSSTGSLLASEPEAQSSAPASSSSSSSDEPSSSSHSVDNSPAPAAADASDHGSSDDQGPAQSVSDATPVAPAVAMVSAEALQAAASVEGNGNSQHGVTVEQVVAEALGHGDAPTVDAALANLPGGIGGLSAIATMASPASAPVSGWDMSAAGATGSAHDMMLSMHAAVMHHDAVQPAVNG